MNGERVLVIQNDSSDPVGTLGGWLADAGLDLEVRLLFAGDELPPDLTGVAGLLVLG